MRSIAFLLALCLLSHPILAAKKHFDEDHPTFEKSRKKLTLQDDPSYIKLEEI